MYCLVVCFDSFLKIYVKELLYIMLTDVRAASTNVINSVVSTFKNWNEREKSRILICHIGLLQIYLVNQTMLLDLS